ncbi:hypothetical protein [Thioalkalivibrio sp. HK1]|uniref:hypothetical protein n=1 Tax=Thioalkalivibrio sp. HK1 TaxID=1469245 RepID=UPI000472BC74|nr:hypothetical protein [Thioalkalivibrio sp. HK1]
MKGAAADEWMACPSRHRILAKTFFGEARGRESLQEEPPFENPSTKGKGYCKVRRGLRVDR